MLPILNKKSKNTEFQASQIKLYNPPRELESLEHFQSQRKSSLNSSSRHNSKIRAAGFKKAQPNSQSQIKKQSFVMLQQKYHQTNNNNNPTSKNMTKDVTYNSQNMKYQNFYNNNKLNSAKDLSAEIKLIQKKIRYHKKKLQEQKKQKQQMQKHKNNPHSQDFQKIIKKQMQLQGYHHVNDQNDKGFDYLTNPNKANQQSEQLPEVKQSPIYQPHVIQTKFNIDEKVQKLEKHYENNLRKKFQRRQMFPHYPCKRKTPKLYITSQTNTLEKFGKKPPQQQHIFRVMTKECTPQEIYPTIPQFAVVKDNLARNVLAYLGDYKPFLEKTKQDDINEKIVKDNTEKQQINQTLQNDKNA